MKLFQILFCSLLFMGNHALAQDKTTVRFFKVNNADFTPDLSKVDTSLGAVILADVGSSSFTGNSKGWFTLVFKRSTRILITNPKGFEKANVKIELYNSSKSDDKEKLTNVKGVSYNLQNGQIIETKLNSDAVFEEQLDKNHLLEKFTLPSIKVGTIIDYSYTINSDFIFNLQPWEFQGDIPRLWSEYEVEMPEFFTYVFLAQGYQSFHVQTHTDRFYNYTVRRPSRDGFGSDETITVPSNNKIHRWVIKEVPALKEEKFTTSINNYITKIEFQLSGYNFPQQPFEPVMGDWNTVCTKLKQNENFGEALDKNNGWMKDEVKSVAATASNRLTEAIGLYEFVRDNFTDKGIHGIYLSQSLKETFKKKSGYAEDLNLLLVAILRQRDFDAKPVLLSTRGNGFSNEYYPLLNRFNYVICRVVIDQVEYFLDASKSFNGFNKLPAYCYNGHARLIGDVPVALHFYADSLREAQLTSVILFNDDKTPGSWSGSTSTTFGYYESYGIRSTIAKNGKANYLKSVKDSYTGDYSSGDVTVEQLGNYEMPVIVGSELTIKSPEPSDIIYLNPMLNSGLKENYFKAATRFYPVEMPYKMDESYIFQIDIPKGYVVDEMPKSVKVNFNEDEGFFEFIMSKTDTEINLRSRIRLEKAFFLPEDYESLRNFFDYIVKKHAEQIVFKKK